MRFALRFPVLLTLAAVPLAWAQTNPGAITRAAPVVVAESVLNADAEGTTRLHLDVTAPNAVPSLDALSTRVANLHIDSGGAGSFGDLVTLRGLSNTPYFSDPSVTLTFDDIPIGSSFTYPTGLFGFASATVARGPQGTTSGRGGEGGSITLTSLEPERTAAGEVRASVGNYNTHLGSLEVRSARGDVADATASASFLQRDGYIANTTLGTRVDDQDSYSAAARLRVRPLATGEITLQLLGSRHRDGAQPLVPLGGPHFSVNRGREGSTDIDFGGAALKAAFDTPAGRLSETTSYTDWKLNPYNNRLVLPPTLDSNIVQTQRTWNEEIRLASATHAAIAWQVGAWFSDGHTVGDVNRGLVIPAPTNIPVEVSHYALSARTAAIFGEADFTPAPGWRLTAGWRIEEAKKSFDRSQRVPGPGEYTDGKTFDSVQPKLVASYTIDAETTASASVSLGAKPGGWSAYTANAALAAFRAEKATAFETGLATTLANKTVKLAVRLFDYEIRDYQIERSFNASDYLVVNAPRARSFGGELEATWHPAAEWTIAATLGLTDVTLREFTNPFPNTATSPTAGRTIVVINGVAYTRFDGNRAPYAPPYNANVSATWRPGTGWFATAEVARTGKTFFDESENPTFAAKAHTVTNARVGYETARWRVSLYGENLFDEAYYALIIPGVNNAVPGAPRTYGIEAALKW
jgi:iron complex outermembrane recepter protein